MNMVFLAILVSRTLPQLYRRKYHFKIRKEGSKFLPIKHFNAICGYSSSE